MAVSAVKKNNTDLIDTSSFSKMENDAYLNYTKQGQSEKCIQLMLKSDRCVQEALFIGKSADEILMPTTEAEIDYYCDRLKGTISCLSEYRVCLKLMPKTLYSVMTRDAKKTMKGICSSPENKKKALTHLKCFSKEKLDFYYRMLNGYTNVMVHLSKPEIQLQELIGSCCCAFHVLYNNGVETIDRECNALTGQETGVFVGNMVRTMAASAIDVSCGKHSSLDVCNQLQPKEMKLYQQLLEEGQKKRFTFSMVMPLVKILNNLDTNVNI